MTDPSKPEVYDHDTLIQLNAYLDGELDQDQRNSFEARLERESALRALFESMRTLDSELTKGLGALPPSPPSEELLAAVKSFAAAQTPESAASNVVAFEARRKTTVAKPNPWRLPLAAAISLCVGAGAMWMILSQQGAGRQVAAVSISDGIAVKGGALHAALEQTISGEVMTAGQEKIRPILSFAAKDGRFCREFESFGRSGSVVGVACKGERGWAMEVVLAAAAHAPDEMQYAPASGFNAKALDDVVSQLIDGQPMTAEAEAAARAKAWQKDNGSKP
jgi:hypothetical protein